MFLCWFSHRWQLTIRSESQGGDETVCCRCGFSRPTGSDEVVYSPVNQAESKGAAKEDYVNGH